MVTMDVISDESVFMILKYLPLEELVHSASKVCNRWHRIVYKHLIQGVKRFKTTASLTDQEIMHCLKNMPRLRHFHLVHADEPHQIMDTLCGHCYRIESIVVERKTIVYESRIVQLLETYPFLHVFEIYTSSVIAPFHLDFAKFVGKRNYSSNLLLVTMQHYVEWEKYGIRNVITTDAENKVVKILAKRSRSLEYLTIGPKITNAIFIRLLFCQNLKRLFLSTNQESLDRMDFLSFTDLQQLECLHLSLAKKIEIVSIPIYPQRLPYLKKLEIRCEDKLADENVTKLWEVCPKLEHLALSAKGLLDKDFKGIGNCKFLRYIDLSYNRPGLHNECLMHIARGCHGLEFLDMSFSAVSFIYDITVLEPCNKLKYLWMKDHIILNQHLLRLPYLFPDLLELNIKKSEIVSFISQMKLSRQMPELRITQWLDRRLHSGKK